MSDDLKNRGGQDPKRIYVGQTHELHHWSKKFGVTPDELKKAVAAAGTDAEAVERHLGTSLGGRKAMKRSSER
jgi:hypothetical protein